jgi:hypothetical protein
LKKLIKLKPTVGFKLPSAGVTPAPSFKEIAIEAAAWARDADE